MKPIPDKAEVALEYPDKLYIGTFERSSDFDAHIDAMGIALTLAANILSYSFHAYQQELFPTGIRARAAGFVYSWSRLSVIFSSFIIAFVLDEFGALGVFVFIAGAMAVVMATIGIFGPRTTNLALEKIAS